MSQKILCESRVRIKSDKKGTLPPSNEGPPRKQRLISTHVHPQSLKEKNMVKKRQGTDSAVVASFSVSMTACFAVAVTVISNYRYYYDRCHAGAKH